MNKILELIASAIRNTEFEGKTYVVGGYVRDLIMKKTSSDIDLVVEMDQGGGKLAEFLHTSGLSGKPVTFERFGTSFVMIKGHKIEIVMTRKESYPDKTRKPVVGTASIQEDIFRRDFTINSLIMNISNGVISDLTGLGTEDIRNRMIRSTSDPAIIFSEDPLRMLRAIRFAVQLDFKIEADTAVGINKNRDRLKDISWERRRDEFTAMLLSAEPDRAVKMLFEFGLMKYVIPELLQIEGLEQNKYHDKNVLDHSLQVLRKSSPELCLRLAALLHDIGKAESRSDDNGEIHFYGHEKTGAESATKILRRLKYPKKTRDIAVLLIRNHMRLKQAGKSAENLSDKAVYRLIRDLGDQLDHLLELVDADNQSHAPDYRMNGQIKSMKKRFIELRKKIDRTKPPVNGNDIIEILKIPSSRDIKYYLAKAEELWLENPKITKDQLLQELIISKEENMEKQESKVTRTTREGVKKAYDVGEDIVQALSRIVKEIVKTAKTEDMSTKEKVHKLAQEALEGAKEGAKAAQPDAEEFVKKASHVIVDSIKKAAPKVAHFAQDAFVGLYEGAKDVYESKKKDDEEEKKD